MEERQQRKLVVILHADIVGSTELVQENETIAHARIKDVFHRFSDTIASYGGKTHELRGDALVAEFERASDAVSASLSFQSNNATFNTAQEDEIKPQLRIGISMGEVVIADNTVTGAGVVLAQRLEQLAAPGGVCIHGAAYETVPHRLPFHYESLGEQRVKGFKEPVRAYAVSVKSGSAIPAPEPAIAPPRRLQKHHIAGGVIAVAVLAGVAAWLTPLRLADEETALTDRPALPLPDKPSIAVLPFTNMSGDSEQVYFSDGIAEDISTDLSKVSGLVVIARNSSFAYRDPKKNTREIAGELGARYLVMGSIRRQGDAVRISAQLLDAKGGVQLWADRFDRQLNDIFAVQDEVAQTIVESLQLKLTSADRERLVQRREANAAAYDALLRGLPGMRRFTKIDTAQARAFFEKAILLDPEYARAHANLANTHGMDVFWGWSDDPDRSIEQGFDSAERALRLDDRIPQVHFALSVLHLARREHAPAVASAERSVLMNPNYADGYGMVGMAQLYAGNLARALEAITKAKELNPRYPFMYLWIEGHIHFLRRDFLTSIAMLEEVASRNPAFDAVQLLLTAAHAHRGDLDSAEWAASEALTIRPSLTVSSERRNALYQRTQHLDLYTDGLRLGGVPE